MAVFIKVGPEDQTMFRDFEFQPCGYVKFDASGNDPITLMTAAKNLTEIPTWLEENCIGKYRRLMTHVFFESEQDATLFYLAFGDRK